MSGLCECTIRFAFRKTSDWEGSLIPCETGTISVGFCHNAYRYHANFFGHPLQSWIYSTTICCSGLELHPKLPCTQSSLCLGVLKADGLQPTVPATDSSVAVSIHSWSRIFLSQRETDCSDCQPCSFWGFFRVKLLPLETGTLPSLW